MKPSIKSILLLLALSLSTFTQAQELLGYNLETGQNFIIKQSALQEMTMDIENTQQIITNDMESVFSFTVAEITESGYNLTFEFKDFAMKSSSNLQGTMIDVRASEPKEGDIMSAIFAGLLGSQLQISLLKTGEISSVSGADQLIENMLNAAGDLDEFTKNLMRKSLDKDFSSESLSNNFEQMTFIYSDKAVDSDSSWTTNFEGKINSLNEWKIEKIEGDTVSLSGNSAITMNTQESSLSMDLSGKQEIVLEASKETGFLTKMMVKANGEGSSTMSMAENVEIPTKLTQTITYELIEE
ncbi:DUF6263 family protein [Croceivirga thetidis]|uniref:Uncharacterized protein n=1 Tax=Croceivirga thetidis TaxID=2721623 RepID=A0ABX1GUD7_9FLAO|nr:DUF6263 family protein [Croceivirga thetidis]NKI32646.1 hypothetical protein [Croceivirga thetidis]